MKKIAASGFVAALALALLAGPAGAQFRAATVAHDAAPVAEPAHAVEIGQCEIQYDTLTAARQPVAMECEHALWLARSWGGRVMEQTSQSLVQRAIYNGRNDFTGVPESALPRNGYCRAWINGVDASAQPAETDCRTARTEARARGGRVIFMPL